MKRLVLPGILVVEGKTDSDFIGRFVDCEIVTTNGSAVSRETLDYLKEASKKKSVIVLTDPDYPGSRIRNVVSEAIPTALHAFIPREKAVKGKKLGVAESDEETILTALSNLIPVSSSKPGTISNSDLFELGLLGNGGASARREVVSRELHLGHVNGKGILKRLNALGITKKEIEDVLKRVF